MRNAVSVTLLLIGAAVLTACRAEVDQQNDSVAAEANAAGPVDIDTLPPDESVATPTDDLANGVDDTNDGEPENGF